MLEMATSLQTTLELTTSLHTDTTLNWEILTRDDAYAHSRAVCMCARTSISLETMRVHAFVCVRACVRLELSIALDRVRAQQFFDAAETRLVFASSL